MVEKLISDIDGLPSLAAPIYEDLNVCLSEVQVDVLLDLTTPEIGKKTMCILP
ncbi:hypothetical protein GCM10020331_067440 [Ectobacillus funiculus]